MQLLATIISRAMRSRRVLRVVSPAIGCLTGLAVFGISQTTGVDLYIITGGIAAMVALSFYEFYGRGARLTQVKITVPQLSELTFVINNDARQVAWQLFIETVTRISTQRLPDDQGVIREALSSLYGLFAVTREVLKSSRPSISAAGGITVESLAINMLNRELRPFLAKWHPALLEFEKSQPGRPESEWPQQSVCRDELRNLQANMANYVTGFAKLAGVPNAGVMLTT